MSPQPLPRRIQLSRAAGWRMPAGAVKVDRSTKWGNPHRVEPTPGGSGRILPMHREAAVHAFRRDLLAGALAITVEDVRRELRGKELACWCQLDHPCHAQVLLEIANEPERESARKATP